MKRKLSIVLMLVLCLSLILGGCVVSDGGKVSDVPSGTTDEEDSFYVTPAGQLPIVKEKITLTAFQIMNAGIVDYETNEFTKWLEEQTNIHLDWMLQPEADVNSKLNLILASGTGLPDIFIRPSISRTLLVEYSAQDVFLPLNDYIEEYGVEIKRYAEMYPELIPTITLPDGNIYSLFSKKEVHNLEHRTRYWMNQTWLDTLNLSIPTTTDELYNVLVAFRDGDPNGNNKKDEIPLTGLKGNNGEKKDGFIMNAFVYNDVWARKLNMSNGIVEASYTKPEYKEGIVYIRRLAAEGLLDPLSFTQDPAQLRQLVNNPEVMLVGSVLADNYNRYAGGRNFESVEHFVIVPPLKGPNGHQAAVYTPNRAGVGSYVVTKQCKYPEAAFRLGDFLFSDEAALRSQYGVPGVDWIEPDPALGLLGINGKPATLKPILEWGSTQNQAWAVMGCSYIPEKYANGIAIDTSDPFEFELILYNAAKAHHAYAYDEPWPTLYFTPEETTEKASMDTQITTYVEEFFARMVLEENVDLDKEWDVFQSELIKIGLPRYLELHQICYDRMYK